MKKQKLNPEISQISANDQIQPNPIIFIFFFLSSVSICMHKTMIQFFVSGDITIKRIFEFD